MLPKMLWSHSRSILTTGYKAGLVYDIPLWLPAEIPDFHYGVVRHPERILLYAFPTRNNISILLQESKDDILHKSPQELLREPQGRDKAEGTGGKALA